MAERPTLRRRPSRKAPTVSDPFPRALRDIVYKSLATRHIRYFGIRDEKKRYRGVLDASLDISRIQKLEGEKQLLDGKECSPLAATCRPGVSARVLG